MFPNSVFSTSTGLSFTKILSGISKTLGVVNQAIPLYQQVKPIISKGKTLLKIASAFNSSSSPRNTTPSNSDINNTSNSNNSNTIETSTPARAINPPQFFL